MKFSILITILSLWTVCAQAQDSGKEFTLKGRTPLGKPAACFLYVDGFGYDEELPGTNKFFAVVRTSYQPEKSIFVYARSPGLLTSVDRNGRPSRELLIRLRGPASEQTLYRATSYKGAASSKHYKGIACAMLRPVMN